MKERNGSRRGAVASRGALFESSPAAVNVVSVKRSHPDHFYFFPVLSVALSTQSGSRQTTVSAVTLVRPTSSLEII